MSRELPRIAHFVTLSPAPNFADWLNRERVNEASLVLDEDDREALVRAGATGLVARSRHCRRRSVSRCCARPPGIICAPATAAACRPIRSRVSISATALGSSGSTGSATHRAARCSSRYGLMVNYLYDLDYIEQNHEAYAQQHAIVAASSREPAGAHADARSGADFGVRAALCILDLRLLAALQRWNWPLQGTIDSRGGRQGSKPAHPLTRSVCFVVPGTRPCSLRIR